MHIAGNVFADEATRAQFGQAISGVSSIQAEIARYFQSVLKHNVGIGAVEDLVLFGLADLEALLAPLNFSSLEMKKPKCVGEQANNEACD